MSEKTPERNNVSMTMETFCFYDEFLLRYLSFVMVKKMLRVWKILPHSTIFNINMCLKIRSNRTRRFLQLTHCLMQPMHNLTTITSLDSVDQI